MVNSQKKLSTKPIFINVPTVTAQEPPLLTQTGSLLQELPKPEDGLLPSTKPEDSLLESSLLEGSLSEATKPEGSLLESSKPEDSLLESSQLEGSLLESNKLEDSLLKSSKLEGSLLESTEPEDSLLESSLLEGGLPESSKPEEGLPESNKLEGSLLEYKKVAMRLSRVAAGQLQQIRITTGIPYEILVDVMIRNWENLPVKTQNYYLKQAQQLRAQRLLAGQEKTLQTMKKRLDG